MLAEGGLIEPDFRKRDEEKFAYASGPYVASTAA
jgi:hypothetical protein